MSTYHPNVHTLDVRASKELLEKFEHVVTPHVSDNMNRLYGTSHELRPYHDGKKLIGTAFTVKTRPGDNLLVHKALKMAQPGDVLVIDAGGEMANAIVGEIMMNIAIRNELAGFVVDGAIRDSRAFIESDFPVYAKGVTHRGPYKDGPGEINVPVSISGMVVNPGDIILGDEDGIVAIPIEEAAKVLERVQVTVDMENKLIQEIKDGTPNGER